MMMTNSNKGDDSNKDSDNVIGYDSSFDNHAYFYEYNIPCPASFGIHFCLCASIMTDELTQ